MDKPKFKFCIVQTETGLEFASVPLVEGKEPEITTGFVRWVEQKSKSDKSGALNDEQRDQAP